MRKTGQTNYVKYGELSRIKGVTTIIRADVAGKQDKLTEPQLAAVNSGITAAKVQAYDIAAGFAHSHDNKTTVLDKLKWSARNNAIYIGDEDHPINFYVYGAITAGGVGSGGGGGQGGISTIYLGSTRYDAEEGSTAIYLPAYPTQVTWANISGKPSWIGSSKPSYAFSEITGAASAAQIPSLDASKITTGTFDAARIPGLDWSKITSGKPTTIAGYGITDGVTTATLAAWSGSVNITKVGTIATGVWHGTAIGDSYIASATNWNDAYDKRHVHSNKTVLDSITAQDITDLRNLASWFGWDSTNKAVYVKKSATDEARNFYAYGAITAGGVGSGGGGSTGALYTCVDVTAYNSSKVGRDSTHPAQSGDLLAFDGNKWHAVVAPATGVTSFGEQAGAIIVRGGQTANGSVNLAMSGTQLQASIVGLGSLAYKSSLSSTDVTTALGYTPYNASNPNGYISVADYITYRDTRSANPVPYSTDFKKGIEYALKNNTADGLLQGGTYHGVMTLHQWGDVSGGDAWQLGFTANGRIYARHGTSAWGAWGGLAFTSDIPTNNNQLTNGAGYITSSGSCAYATSAGNADTLDGQHGSYFQPLATAINTGNIASQSVAYSANSGYADVLRDPSYHDYSHRRTSGNLNWADAGLHYFLATSTMTEGKPNGDGHVLHMSWDNGSWEAQLSVPSNPSNNMQWRAQYDAWGAWNVVYDSHNANKSDVAWACSTLTASGITFSGTSGKKVTFSAGETLDGFGSFIFGPNSSSWNIFSYNSSTAVFSVTTAGNVTAAGNVGIGRTSASAKLDVEGEVMFSYNSDATIKFYGATNPTQPSSYGTETFCIQSCFDRHDGHTSTYPTSYPNRCVLSLQPRGGRVAIGALSSGYALYVVGDTVSTGAITAGSDRRWKDNINYSVDGISAIMALRPATWDWKEGHGKGKGAGLIAQDVQRILPYAVVGDEESGYTLNYNVFHAFEISSLQNHESRIEALERENAELKRRLNING